MPPSTERASWPRLLAIEPAEPVKLSGAVLVAALIVVAVIDVVQITDEPVGLWALLFGNGGPIEWMQWGLLGITAIAASFLSARLRSDFFYLFAFAAALLLIEDAGDPRHRLSVYVRAFVGDDIGVLPTSTVVELTYFAALAAVPLYAFWRYRTEVWSFTTARRYLLGGYGLYAVAALASGTRKLGSYETVGLLIDDALGGRLAMGPYDPGEGHLQFIDGVVEESIELLAAACLLALVLACAKESRGIRDAHRDEPIDTTDDLYGPPSSL